MTRRISKMQNWRTSCLSCWQGNNSGEKRRLVAHNSQIFESFLQNFIKNFEEHEARERVMNQRTLRTVLRYWHSAIPVSPRKYKVREDDALQPELEAEYMGLIAQFRKVDRQSEKG